MKLKVCGMKYPDNIRQLIDIKPDYMGFIFYPKSKRFMADSLAPGILATFPSSIQKVGVFVNETIEKSLAEKDKFGLDFVQLHGNESPEICEQLKTMNVKIIKAFQVSNNFDFTLLKEYKEHCEYFLFDTQTPLYGGSGIKFDWEILTNYNNEKPFFLSGGIDLIDIDKILNIKNLNIHSIDINSKFEIEPGLKDIEKIRKFKEQLN